MRRNDLRNPAEPQVAARAIGHQGRGIHIMSAGNIFAPTLSLDSALFDVVSLTKLLASAIWALRIDVAGYLSQYPAPTVEEGLSIHEW